MSNTTVTDEDLRALAVTMANIFQGRDIETIVALILKELIVLRDRITELERHQAATEWEVVTQDGMREYRGGE